MINFYYGKYSRIKNLLIKKLKIFNKKLKMLKEKQITSLFLIYHSIISLWWSFCLFIIKRFAQINIFKLSDDILHLILHGFVYTVFIIDKTLLVS